jgi:hypothetical protein
VVSLVPDKAVWTVLTARARSVWQHPRVFAVLGAENGIWKGQSCGAILAGFVREQPRFSKGTTRHHACQPNLWRRVACPP